MTKSAQNDEPKPIIRVVIVEDEEPKRKEICELVKEELDMELAGEYRNPEDALTFIPQKADLDIVIVDLKLKAAKTGIDVIKELKAHFDKLLVEKSIKKPVRFLVNTISEDREDVYRAIKAGAEGYILKGDRHRQIAEAIRDLYQGWSPMSSQIARLAMEELAPQSEQPKEGAASLTPREKEVLDLLSQGWTNGMIAEKLKITVGVVKLHCNHIYQKLHLRRQDIIFKYNGNGAKNGESLPKIQPGFWDSVREFFAKILGVLFPKSAS